MFVDETADVDQGMLNQERGADSSGVICTSSGPRALRRLAVFAALVLTVLVASTQAGAREAGSNLVQNAGAESGPSATGSEVVVPTGWTTTESFTVGRYGADGFPPAPAGGGSNVFAGGPGSPLSTASQEMDVSGNASAIDAGRMQATLSALLGGWESQNDAATVRALFLNSNGLVLDHFAIGPVTAADRGYKSKLLRDSRSEPVPAETRSIRVVIAARRASGIYNDGYADNVSLTLSVRKLARAHYRFGFRIFDRESDISAGSRGQFTTEGPPNATGDMKVVDAAAKDLKLGWSYRGKKYVIVFRFRGDGTYDRANEYLSLELTIRSANVPRCRRGAEAAISIDGTGDVMLFFCGRRVNFLAPSRATSWVKLR